MEYGSIPREGMMRKQNGRLYIHWGSTLSNCPAHILYTCTNKVTMFTHNKSHIIQRCQRSTFSSVVAVPVHVKNLLLGNRQQSTQDTFLAHDAIA